MSDESNETDRITKLVIKRLLEVMPAIKEGIPFDDNGKIGVLCGIAAVLVITYSQVNDIELFHTVVKDMTYKVLRALGE